MTLTGAGGVGKTRLALHAATDMARAFPDGVWLIPLAPIEDPRLVTQAVFHALGLQDKGAGWSVSALTDFLTEKHLLLVLDNCEHLLDSSAVLTSTLLQACPQIRVLATSRQALGIAGEFRLRVPSLSLPETGSPVALDRVLDFEAVALLAERALAVLPSFRIDAKNVAAVVRVCERLDGIPLALELAAVRLEALSLDQLNQALDRELSVLGEGNRGALPRQQTLEATIGWSYLLLSEQERQLWARLAVFTGSFDEEAAVEVCSGSGLPGDEIAALLAKLVEKSILKRDPAAEPTRYMLLETLRQYGRQKLREIGGEVELQRRHRDWVLGLAATAATMDHKQAAMFDRIYLERDNLWAALDFCVRQPGEAERGIEICRHLHRYLASRGPMRDARRVLASLIDLSPPDGLARGRGLWVSAVLAVTLPDYVDAKSKAEEGLRIGRLLGDVEVMACSLRCLGIVARAQGRIAEADQLAESALALARAMQSAPITLAVMNSLCGVRLSAGDLDGVVALGEEALAMSMESGELWMRGYLLNHVSKARWQLGETQVAEALAQEGIFCKHALDDRFGLAILIDTLAWMVVQRGAAERAAMLLGHAQYLRESVAALPLANFDPQRKWSEVSAREAIGDAAFAAAVARGRAMTIDEGVAYALDQKKQTKPAPLARERATPLTRRQLEIASLVAQGLSNKQIAARLVVSERTADSHVLNILNKLGFNSRAQIANWVGAKEPLTSIRT